MTSLVSLRAALYKATPGPWETRFEAESDGSGVWGIDGIVETGGYDGMFKGGIDNDADAALIVAAVNALPALLDIAQAAQAFLEVNSVIGGGRQVEPAYQALREALAALDKEQT